MAEDVSHSVTKRITLLFLVCRKERVKSSNLTKHSIYNLLELTLICSAFNGNTDFQNSYSKKPNSQNSINLIRPPILNVENNNQEQNSPPQMVVTTDVEHQIANLVIEQCRRTVQAIINPNADLDYGTDQKRYRNDLSI